MTEPFLHYCGEDVQSRFGGIGSANRLPPDKLGKFMLFSTHIDIVRQHDQRYLNEYRHRQQLQKELQELNQRESIPGLTDLEKEILSDLMKVWNKFRKLTNEHFEQNDEFRAAIHRCQDAVASRPVYRALNRS